MRPFDDPAVAAVYDGFPEKTRALALRDMILNEAALMADVGDVSETLKWGQPSYRPVKARVGTSLRIWSVGPGQVGVYAPCQTTVIPDFREMFGDMYCYDGNRGVLVQDTDALENLAVLIRHGLRYHLKR